MPEQFALKHVSSVRDTGAVMKHLIRPSLVAWLLTAALLSTLVSQTLGATGPSRVYLPVITNGHPKPGTTPTTTPPLTPSTTATVTPTIAPSVTPTATSTITPSVTPTATSSVTPTGTVTPVESFRATAVPSASQVEVGQTLVVTATVYNEGSGVSFGLPQYRLRVETAPGVEQDQAEPLLTPARPDPVTHYLGVGPGGSDSAVFTFQAVRPGTFSFALSVSGEVCIIGAPGCAGGHWSGASARSITVTVVSDGATPTSAAPSVTPASTVTPTVIPTTVPTTGGSLTGHLAIFPKSAATTTITAPQMHVIIVDVSASTALNFYGQATIGGVTRQCGFGPSDDFNARRGIDISYCASVPLPAWSVASEQRFSIVRQAIITFINSLGPDDRVALLPMDPDTLLSPAPLPLTLTDAAGKSALVSQLNALSPTGVGTPAATALRKARQTLTAASTPATAPSGQPYKRSVLMLVDGIANYYLEAENGAYLSTDDQVGWENLAQDQPDCGMWVAETVECQVGYTATTTNGRLARPIVAMVEEGTKLQREPVQIFVAALAGVEPVGLDMVASNPYQPWFQNVNTPDRLNAALAQIADTLRPVTVVCETAPSTGWVYSVSPEHRPNPTGHPGIDEQTFGFATLTAESGATYTAPVRHTRVGGEDRLTYGFEQVPRGSYALSAYVLYKGDDGVTRRYDLILNDDLTSSLSRPVTVTGGGISQVFDPLWLQLNGNVCEQAQLAGTPGRAAPALVYRRRSPL
jgi:hypothetical protein